MTVRIKSQSTNLTFWFPTGLVFGRPTVWLANSVGRKYAPEAMINIPPQALAALFGELRRIKKHYGKWELVDIESSDGSVVRITL